MNCREAMAVISEFLEQSLSPETLARFEGHLTDGASCRAYLETYGKTIALTGRTEDVETPAEMKTRLRNVLLEELRRGRASS
jgi:predicted anti-sigma-YlaC factor YlaD